jgi:small subunit ribosomal protein S16
MVVIRLARSGSKKSPFYHVVIADRRSRRDGRFIERIGYFNPVAQGESIRLELQKERIDHWIKLGAQPTDRVSSLVKEFAGAGNKKIKASAVIKSSKKKTKAASALAEKTETVTE